MARIVVIGASMGGLDAISEVLSCLPPSFDASIAIVQHRRPDSDSAILRALTSRSRRSLIEPDDKAPLRAGSIYLAPAGYHLLVEPGRLALSVDAPVLFARPSIDVLFESAASAYGAASLGVLLTGASDDGALGLERIRRVGGSTLVQDPAEAESAVAPRAAIERGSAELVLPLRQIADVLAQRLR